MSYFKGIKHIKIECEQEFEMLRKTTCCFSGHRPQNLPWGCDELDKRCLDIRKRLRKEIIRAIKKGYKNFITGMALGFDTMCAEIVLELKKLYPDIQLIGAIPCKTQDKYWNVEDQKRYRNLIDKLDKIRCIYNTYIGSACMIERNRYMVNNSSLLISLYNGREGGTKKTIDCARQQNLNIVILHP